MLFSLSIYIIYYLQKILLLQINNFIIKWSKNSKNRMSLVILIFHKFCLVQSLQKNQRKIYYNNKKWKNNR